MKLDHFEDRVEKTVERLKWYPEQMATGAHLKVEQHECLKLIGELLVLRGQMNLHSDLLDTPDIFWQAPDFEHHFTDMMSNMDVETRIELLNKRLDYANELTDLLRQHLSDEHGHRLEIIIIVLIAIEIGIALYEHADLQLLTSARKYLGESDVPAASPAAPAPATPEQPADERKKPATPGFRSS